MIFHVRKHNNLLASLKFERGAFSVEDAIDEYFLREMKQMIIDGVFASRDIYDANKKMYLMVQEHIRSDHPNFALALKQYLERQGYEVEEHRPELQDKIRSLLDQFPGEESKRTMLAKLPTMSYLQQTFLLGQLGTFLNSEETKS